MHSSGNPKMATQLSRYLTVTSALLLALLMQGCATDSVIKTTSENFNSRVGIIVIHHTSSNFADSLKVLTVPSSYPVSSHYLVPEPNDPSYTKKKLEIYQLVPETGRAWHAGNSYWGGRTALNDQSIGIEIVNQTYCRNGSGAADIDAEDASRICFYPDFPETQMELVIGLLADLVKRYPEIPSTNIVGHSDIAPDRKIDPGPRFPWQRLYRLGYGAWFDDETVVRYWDQFRKNPLPLRNIQQALQVYGYGVETNGELDEHTRNVLRAFQLHFRPSQVSSEPTVETAAILFALIEKYHPDQLQELLQVEEVIDDATTEVDGST